MSGLIRITTEDGRLILAATAWRTNAELIRDVAALGYLDKEVVTLDPTYGRGKWWSLWRPFTLIAHDLYTLDGVDFRQLPEEDGSVGQVAYDPAYVCPGGRATSTLPDFNDRFGLSMTPRTPAALQEMNDAGLKECLRVVAPGGVVLVKAQDYVWSGRLQLGTHWTLSHALAVGFTVVDRLEHIGHARAQPGGRTREGPNGERVPTRQQHARRNLSTLFVLRAPRRRRVS